MPNHCDNDLRICGAEEDLNAFMKKAGTIENGLIDFNNFIPYPKTYADADKEHQELESKLKTNEITMDEYYAHKDGYNNGGYEWCNKHWGTKWNCYDVKIVESFPGEVMFTFFTAWSPALPIITKMGEMFPNLMFDLRYYESGVGFHGILVCEHGEVVTDSSGEYYGTRGG